VIAVSERINARIPGALIGLGIATAAAMLTGLESRGVTVLGTVSGALPTLAIPDIPAGQLARLVPLSLIIAIVVMVQTAATTRSFPSDPNEPPDVDRDFVGIGAGSILSGLFGAFPVNASPPRTAIVSETGGRSQLAGLVAAAIVFALVAFGAKLLRHVPHAALSGVLLFIALRIIRVRQVVAIYRQSFGEFLLIVSTAAAIIVLPIEQGVAIGIALSLLHGIWSTTRARVVKFERVPGTSVWWPLSPDIRGEREPNVIVAGLQAPLSFLNPYRFRRDILDALQPSTQKARLIVLEATGILEIDFTAAQILSDLIRSCHAVGVAFAIARLESVRAQEAVARFGIDKLLGPGHMFRSVEEAIRELVGATQADDVSAPGRPGPTEQNRAIAMRLTSVRLRQSAGRMSGTVTTGHQRHAEGVASRLPRRSWVAPRSRSRERSSARMLVSSRTGCPGKRLGRKWLGSGRSRRSSHTCITTRWSSLTGRLCCSQISVRVRKRLCCNCQLLRSRRGKRRSKSALLSSPNRRSDHECTKRGFPRC
jgi:Sulfate permease family/STAS domain